MADIPRPKSGRPDLAAIAELAVATRSPILMYGPAGNTGQVMFARRVATLMSDGGRFLRAPHHSITPRGLLREWEQARYGLLYLDEIDNIAVTSDNVQHILTVYGGGPDAPLLLAGIKTHPGDNRKTSSRIERVEKRWFHFPIKLEVQPITIEDLYEERRRGRTGIAGMVAQFTPLEPDASLSNPWSSASIRARIDGYDPEARLIAHDLVEEGEIDKAWEVLRGGVVEHRRHKNPPNIRSARTREEVIAAFKEAILQPDIESLVIAQDLLEESGLTLADVSREPLDPSLVAQGSTDDTDAGGQFIISPARREGELPDAVIWSVEEMNLYHRGKSTGFQCTWALRVTPWRAGGKGTAMSPAWARDKLMTRVDSMEYAIYRCVQYAWLLVKMMKNLGEPQDIDDVESEFQELNESLVLDFSPNDEYPATPAEMISPYARLRVAEREARENPEESMPSSKALHRYVGFHQHDPKRIGEFHGSLKIPATATLIGDAVHVLYKSDKRNPTTGVDEGWINYIHEHDEGVKVYRCDARGRNQGVERPVPQWLQRADDLVWLGQCNGFAYEDADGQHEVKGTRPYPDLFCTPNGKALLVIQGKRTLLALIWGGRLGVEPRGIVH